MTPEDLNWQKEPPRIEGWWFWRKQKNQTDPFKWNAYYILYEGNSKDYYLLDANLKRIYWTAWSEGTHVLFPAGGWWAPIMLDLTY